MNKTTLTHRFAKGLVLFFIIALALALNLGQPPFVAHADEGTVTDQEARRAALAWLNVCPDFVGIAYTPAPEMLGIKDQEQRQTIAYVLELQPKGFIIVTPNFELNPIIAYSENSVFDATETPENILLDLLRGDISDRLRALENREISSSYRDKARSRWEDYLEKVDDQGRVRTEGAPLRLLQSYDVEHGPFLTSEWGQSTDGASNLTFNYYTPSNYVCGCVATALGQILNYYEWPTTGTGSYTYTWDNGTDPAEDLSADFGASTYDWDNVLDDYTGTGTSLTERQAAGTVIYHAGVAVDMNYTSGSSSANTRDVADALQNHFRATGEWVLGTESDFYDRLYANMINHRPGELSIHDTVDPVTAGHAVVVDGVRHNTGGTKYYHLNMGWTGTDDAWYDIANPFTTGSYTWDTMNGVVLDIVPTPNLNDPGTTTTGAAIPVSWDVADLQDASKYELQQAAISNSLGDSTDDAESGTGNWAIDGYWEQSSYYSHSPSYSFHGDFYDGSTWEYPGTFTLEKAVKIDASTTITYWYRVRNFTNYEARFQIADDGTNEKDWTTLETYTSTVDVDWILETISTADLSAYAGKVVSLRFVIDHLGGSISYGSAGFYFDDFTINAGYIGSDWTTVDDNITTESKAVPVTEGGEYCYRVRAYGCDPSVQTSCSGQWWDWSDVESITVVSDSYASAATGDWSTGGTWVGGVPPTSSSAIIKNGHTVTVDSDAQCNDLVIESGGTLVVPTGVTLTITGDWVNDGTFTPNTGTVTFNGTSAQAIGGNNTFYNLTSANSGGGVTDSDGALTVSNLLRVQSNTFTSASDLADVQIDGGATLALSGDITVSGNWVNSGTFTHNDNGVTFDGTTAISGSSTNSFASLTVSGNLTAPSGNMNVAGNWSSTGTFSPNSGTVIFNGASDQTITASSNTDFNHLQIGDGSSTQTVTANSDLDVNGNLTIQTGASLAGGSNTIRVASHWTDNGTGFVQGASTVIFDGTTQTVNKSTESIILDEDFSHADEYTGGSYTYTPPSGWAVTNEADGLPWGFWGGSSNPNNPNTGGHARRFWQSDPGNNPIDTWLFTPQLNLDSDLSYRLQFKYGAWSWPENLQVQIGTGQASGSMTTGLYTDTNFTHSSWATSTVTFTVSSSGVYYIGFHSYGNHSTSNHVAIDDINLTAISDIIFYNITVGSTGSATFDEDVVVKNNLTVNSGATVVLPTNTIVDGTLTNSGTLQQTQDVNGTSNVGFFNTGSYGGVTLNANGTNLGSTIVNIGGNQDCTDGASGSSVQRCFNIAPENTSGLNATMRLYFSASELGSTTCGSMKVWHWGGSSWSEAGTVNANQCSTEPYYVEVTGVSSFSPLVGDDNEPGGGPTAVTLACFTASPAQGGNGFALALVALGAVVGTLVLRARR